MSKRIARVVLSVAGAAGCAMAQIASGGSSGPAPKVPPPDSVVTRPILISGAVVMEDGSALPRGVAVKSICGGVERPVATPHADGKFEFQWGASSQQPQPDASQGNLETTTATLGLGGITARQGGSLGGVSGDQITNCELGVAVAGYRSSTINLFNHSSTSNPNVGTIILRKIGADEGHFVSVAAMQAPKDARKAWDDALLSLQKNLRPEALANFQKAVKLYPKFADAWSRIGIIQMQMKANEPAKEAFAKAMELDNKLIAPWQEMGFLASMTADWPETAKYLDEAVKLDPKGSPRAWYLDATAHYNLKHYDVAEIAARKAIELDPKHLNPRGDFLLGLVLIAKEDYKGGAEMLRRYMEASPNAGDLDMVRDELTRIQEFIK